MEGGDPPVFFFLSLTNSKFSFEYLNILHDCTGKLNPLILPQGMIRFEYEISSLCSYWFNIVVNNNY